MTSDPASLPSLDGRPRRLLIGGHRMSGWGHECGPDALDQYLTTKAVWSRTD